MATGKINELFVFDNLGRTAVDHVWLCGLLLYAAVYRCLLLSTAVHDSS